MYMIDTSDIYEIDENVKDSIFFLKIAFNGLFVKHEYEKAELVFCAIEALKLVHSDIKQPKNVWKANDLDKEISECIDKAAELISGVQKITSQY